MNPAKGGVAPPEDDPVLANPSDRPDAPALARRAVLAIDATADCGAAMIWRAPGGVLAARSQDMPRGGGGEALIGLTADVLAESGLGWESIDRLVVARGPGSFTGVRIGIAAARGLALALGRPAIGVDGFDVLRAQAQQRHPDIARLAIVFGRTPRLVWRRYARGADGALAADGPLQRGDAEALQAAPTDLFIGPAAEAAAPRPAAAGGLDLETLARLGAEAPDDGARPTPLYLRPPDAAEPSFTPPPRLGGR